MENNKIIKGLFIFIVIVLTVVLRVLYIDCDFWYDEACSWFSAIQEFPVGIMKNLMTLDMQHTPLYFFLLHFWIKIFGDGEIAIRSLSVIFGILTVPVVYVAASKITNKTNSVIACLISAVSPLLVFFSAEARMYPMAVFLVMLSLNYLIDFEQKNDKKSLIKLIFVNLLIPHTLVGGILYNIALAVCYGVYLFRKNKDILKLYLKGVLAELILLVPYFVLISYYAKMRLEFVIRHEGGFFFTHIVDVIRNFFGIELVDNIYWPSVYPYTMNLEFTLLVVVPCVYFVYGLVQGCKNSEGFLKTLYYTFFVSLVLSVIFAMLHVNVFTVRYILYLLPPMIILGIIGLSKRISLNHLKAFAVFYILGSIICGVHYTNVSKDLKTIAYKAVRIEADKNGLNAEDLVILPFGADAPYYFRQKGSPRVLPFDFHKQARNPKNNNFYDVEQQKNPDKDRVIYDSIFSDKGFSDNHYEYFQTNVIDAVKPGRYVLIGLYGTDAQQLVTLEELRKSVTSLQDIKDQRVKILLQKYLYDIRAYLDNSFDFLGNYTQDNYTYLLFQKR